jgi:hypothetical protein
MKCLYDLRVVHTTVMKHRFIFSLGFLEGNVGYGKSIDAGAIV